MKTQTEPLERKEMQMDLLKCGVCHQAHPNLNWKPFEMNDLKYRGKEVSHYAICPETKNEIIFLVGNESLSP